MKKVIKDNTDQVVTISSARSNMYYGFKKDDLIFQLVYDGAGTNFNPSYKFVIINAPGIWSSTEEASKNFKDAIAHGLKKSNGELFQFDSYKEFSEWVMKE